MSSFAHQQPGFVRRWVITAVIAIIAAWMVGLELFIMLLTPGGPTAPTRFADLTIYREAVSAWVNGGHLYAYASQHPETQGLGFTYPPFAAVAFTPLLLIPPHILQWAWTLGTFVVTLMLVRFIVRSSVYLGATDDRLPRATAVALALLMMSLSYPFIADLTLGQVSLVIVGMSLLDASGGVPRRLRGTLIGIAAAIKLTPLVFLPYLLVTGQRAALARALAIFAGTTAVAFAVDPRDSVLYWGSYMFDTSRVGEIWRPWNKSLLALLLRWHAGGATQRLLWVALCLLIASYALLHAWEAFNRGNDLAAALTVGCLSVVVSPVSWTHHQIWGVLVAATLVTARRPAIRWTGAVLYAVFFIGLPFSWETSWMKSAGAPFWRIVTEVPVLAFTTICIMGLPGTSSRPPQPIAEASVRPTPYRELPSVECQQGHGQAEDQGEAAAVNSS